MVESKSAMPSGVDIHRLLETFYREPSGTEALGVFESIEQAPEPYNHLLNHNKHMTVTVESHFGQNVDVEVHRTARDGVWYAREITLTTCDTRRVVQYGIVRLRTDAIAPQVLEEIESERIPLGRVLINHNVLREVELCGLWQVRCGQCLASLLHVTIGSIVYGRTALIHCDNEPAIELLEILAPISSD
jgi:chorismate-pyruvate lyase